MPTKIDCYPIIKHKLPEKDVDCVVETLNELQIRIDYSPEDYVVIGGANMVLRGVKRATTDIDILVSGDMFESLSSLKEAEIKLPPKRALENGATNKSVWLDTYWTKLPISAAEGMGDGYYPISYEAYKTTDLERINGFRCSPLEHVWGSKIALQRPKDIPDLKAIARVLGRSTDFPSPKFKGINLDS